MKERHFSPGDQVLVRTVNPGGKLGNRWDGPCEIRKKDWGSYLSTRSPTET